MKTDGQIVYEYYHPSHIAVVHASALPFASAGDCFYIPNPQHQAPYRLLTQEAKDYWERYAVGHHVLTERRRQRAEEKSK